MADVPEIVSPDTKRAERVPPGQRRTATPGPRSASGFDQALSSASSVFSKPSSGPAWAFEFMIGNSRMGVAGWTNVSPGRAAYQELNASGPLQICLLYTS